MENIQKDEREEIKSELVNVVASLAVINGAIVDKGGNSKDSIADVKYDSFSGQIKNEARESIERIYGQNKDKIVLDFIIDNFGQNKELDEQSKLSETVKNGNKIAQEKLARYTKIKRAIEEHLDRVSGIPQQKEFEADDGRDIL